MSEGLWYYAQEGTRYGPVSLEELRSLARSGGLKAEDLVWSSGMESWTSAGSVPGLLPAVLPPLPVRAAASARPKRRFPWKLVAVAAILAVAVLGTFLWRRLYSPSIEQLLAIVPRDAQALVVVRGLPQLALDLGLFKGKGGAAIAAVSDLVGLAAMELSDEESLLGTGVDVTAPLGLSVHQFEGQEVEVYYLPVADRERLRATLDRFAESKGWTLESATPAGTALTAVDDGRFGFIEHRGHVIAASVRGSGKVAPFFEKLASGEAGSVAEAEWVSSMSSLTGASWHVLALVDPAATAALQSSSQDFEPFGDVWGSRLSDLAGLGARLDISSDAIRLRYQEVSREGVDHGLSRFVGSREDRFASQVAGQALGFARLSIDVARLAEDPQDRGSGGVAEYVDAFKSSLGDADPTAYLGSPLSVAVLKTEPGGEMPVDIIAWMPIKPGHDVAAKLAELARSMGRDGVPVTTEQRDGATWYALKGQLNLAWAVVRDHLVVALRTPQQKVVTADSNESFLTSLRRAELREDLLSQHDMALYVDLEALVETFRGKLEEGLPESNRIYLDSVGGLAAWVDARPRELVNEWTLYPRRPGGFSELVASLAGGPQGEGQVASPRVSIPFLDGSKQKRTISDIRNMGTAYMSWLTDQVGAASAGSRKMVYLESYRGKHLTADEIRADLHPSDTFFYMQEIPLTDAWGHPIEVWRVDNLLLSNVFLIRSPGRDGVFEGDEYEVGAFPATDYDRDIVWVDGYFVRWPEGTKR